MKVTLSVHPKGLGPRQAAKARFLRVKKKAPWSKVRSQTRTVSGKRPGLRALELAAPFQFQLVLGKLLHTFFKEKGPLKLPQESGCNL